MLLIKYVVVKTGDHFPEYTTEIISDKDEVTTSLSRYGLDGYNFNAFHGYGFDCFTVWISNKKEEEECAPGYPECHTVDLRRYERHHEVDMSLFGQELFGYYLYITILDRNFKWVKEFDIEIDHLILMTKYELNDSKLVN